MDWIRRFKPAYELYNVFQKNALQHNAPLYRKYGLQKRYFSSVSSQDFAHLDSPLNVHDKKNSRLELPKQADFQILSKPIQEACLSWSEDGYVILREFFSQDEVEAINAEVERLVAEKLLKWTHGGARIMFAIHHSKLLRDIGTHQKLILVLRLLMGKEMDLFQSINFHRASEQRTHSDTIHMATFPYGNLAAAWIALEKVDTENGTLHYYPGSHKLPYVMNADIGNEGSRFWLGKKEYRDYEDKIAEVIAENGLKKETFEAEAGDVLIWHANLLHGGEPLINENRSRKSMVFHYYSQDAICYHEITQRPALRS